MPFFAVKALCALVLFSLAVFNASAATATVKAVSEDACFSINLNGNDEQNQVFTPDQLIAVSVRKTNASPENLTVEFILEKKEDQAFGGGWKTIARRTKLGVLGGKPTGRLFVHDNDSSPLALEPGDYRLRVTVGMGKTGARELGVCRLLPAVNLAPAAATYSVFEIWQDAVKPLEFTILQQKEE